MSTDFFDCTNVRNQTVKQLIGLLLLLPLAGAEPAGYKYWSAAELKGMEQKLAPKVNAQKVVAENLAKFGADRAIMVHREGSGAAELHKTDADLIVVVSGAGTLVVGGTMPGSKTTAPGEVRAASIDGGTRQRMAPGDILHIPPRTPHQVMLEPGSQITYFTLKVKE
jgi:mannose-6-phosphate isomerase-like protein (cupin superfamily)